MKKYIPLIYFITLSAVFTSCKTVKFDRIGTEAESSCMFMTKLSLKLIRI